MDWQDLRPKPTSEVAAPGVRDGQSRRRVSACQLTHDGKLPAKMYPERRHVRHADLTTALGIDATAVQTLLDHSSLLVTQGYQRVSAEMLAPAMTALQEVLKTTSDGPDGVRRDLARHARRPQ